MKSYITVFLPGLLAALDPDLKLPALATLLSRATQYPGAKTVKDALQAFFTDLQEPIPHAALSALGQGHVNIGDNQTWCFASAVECLVTHQTAYVLGNAHLQLTESESDSLTTMLNQLIQQDGLKLIKSEGPDWLCQVQKHTQIEMQDLGDVQNKNLYPLMPKGNDQAFWHRLLTEVQMLLQSSEVNNQRALTHKPLISSLWFWGIGQLPQQMNSPFDAIYSNDKVITGLGVLANIPTHKLSHLDDINLKSKQILIADSLFYQGLNTPTDSWRDLLLQYEENLFSPLLNGLKKGKIKGVEFIFADARRFNVTKTKLKFFWRKTLPFALLQNQNKNMQ